MSATFRSRMLKMVRSGSKDLIQSRLHRVNATASLLDRVRYARLHSCAATTSVLRNPMHPTREGCREVQGA